jgi:hypothetical protein
MKTINYHYLITYGVAFIFSDGVFLWFNEVDSFFIFFLVFEVIFISIILFSSFKIVEYSKKGILIKNPFRKYSKFISREEIDFFFFTYKQISGSGINLIVQLRLNKVNPSFFQRMKSKTTLKLFVSKNDFMTFRNWFNANGYHVKFVGDFDTLNLKKYPNQNNMICILLMICSLLSISSGFTQKNSNEIVECLNVYSEYSHCVRSGITNRIQFGVSGIPLQELELLSDGATIINPPGKMTEFICPKVDSIQVYLRKKDTMDTLLSETFYVLDDLNSYLYRRSKKRFQIQCGFIVNSETQNYLVKNKENRILFNSYDFDLNNYEIKFINGKIVKIGDGVITVIPGTDKKSTIIFLLDNQMIFMTEFVIR